MDLARSISGLLTWQWVALILGIVFHAPVRGLIDRAIDLSVGGRKGLRIKTVAKELTESQLGRIERPESNPASAPVPKRLEAEEFVLRDSDGNTRAILTISDTRSATLAFYDSDGKERAGLFTGPRGDSALFFLDEHRKQRVVLGFGVGEQGALIITGPDGQVAAGLLIDEKGVPAFELAGGD